VGREAGARQVGLWPRGRGPSSGPPPAGAAPGIMLLWGRSPPVVDTAGYWYFVPPSWTGSTAVPGPVIGRSATPAIGMAAGGRNSDTVTCGADRVKAGPPRPVVPDAAPPALVAAAAPSAAACAAATPLAQPGARLLPLGVLTTWPMQA
jgi:hypothetical protein